MTEQSCPSSIFAAQSQAAQTATVRENNDSSTNAKKELLKMISMPTRVEIIDGRIFRGHLVCTDENMNIILASTTEYFPGLGSGSTVYHLPYKRQLGRIVVPGSMIQSIMVNMSEYESRNKNR